MKNKVLILMIVLILVVGGAYIGYQRLSSSYQQETQLIVF